MTETTEIELEGTELLERTAACTKKIQVHEGGSSSSKTYSICQYLIGWSFEEEGKKASVVRKTLPALLASALDDFKKALIASGAEAYFVENQSRHTFTNRQTGTVIEFFSLDKAQKARGPRRDLLYCNEANELSREDFRQLARRTRGRIIIDYNPSMQKHWLYDDVLTRADCERVHSTYRDNPYLTDDNIGEIEADVPVYEEDGGRLVKDWHLSYAGAGRLVSGDAYDWSVYGLGRRGSVAEAIYRAVYECAAMPAGAPRTLGLDFGYNDPMVLLDVRRVDTEGARPKLYVDELLHASYLTSADLIARLPHLGVLPSDAIYADGARPEMIAELVRAGFNVKPADKGPGSVKTGIDLLKAHDLFFTARSTTSKMEFQDYRWQKRADGTIADVPAGHNDHAPDAARYAAYSAFGATAHTPPKPITVFRSFKRRS